MKSSRYQDYLDLCIAACHLPTRALQHNEHNQTQSLTATHKSCQRAAAVEENNNYPDKLPRYQL